MAQHRSRWHLRRWVGNLLLMGGAVLAVLILIDFTLDRTHWFGARRAYVRPDPLIRYRFEPDARYWFREENPHPVSGRINSHGWRDRPRQLLPPPGVFRIAVCGDSYVEALQVEADSTFCLRAEDALNEWARTHDSTRRFECLNFGRSGFTQSEEWLVLLHDISRFQPDLVVLFFYPGNDIRDIHPDTADGPRPFFHLSENDELILDVRFRESRNYRIRRWLNPLQRRSALVSLVVERLVTAKQAQHIRQRAYDEAQVADHVPGYRSLCTSSPEAAYVRNYALNKRLLQRMVEYCRSRGMDFLLVCLPDAYRPESQDRLRAIDPTFDPGFFSQDLRRFADSLRVSFLDLQDPFERAAEAGATLQWVHWNDAGHALVSRSLMHHILTQSLPETK